jgi:hypothetical protein
MVLPAIENHLRLPAVEMRLDESIEQLLSDLPRLDRLSVEQIRAFLARYSVIAEGNFIQWMAAAHISSATSTAKSITADNLREELSENHPGMLRRFIESADAVPGRTDYAIIEKGVERIRGIMGRLNSVEILLMLAWVETFFPRFVDYLAQAASMSGGRDFQYTDVHRTADIGHSEKLKEALGAEMRAKGIASPPASLFEGVDRLAGLLRVALHGPGAT